MKLFQWATPSLIIILVFLSSCAPPQPTKIVPTEFIAGQNYYHRVCANCHGADALGKKTKAPGLIDTDYLPDNYTDDEIREQIIEGSDKMPSQRNKVSDSEINEIIKYLRYSQQVANLTVEDDEPKDNSEE